jgi:aconitate hydratase
MDAYLRNVGRYEDADDAGAIKKILCQDEDCIKNPEKVFSKVVEIDLSEIRISHSGPFTPDRITPVSEFNKLVKEKNWPEDVSAVLLGSCTNSSYSDLYAAAQIMEEAGRHGLKARVPFLLSPGSTRVYETIKRDGILDKLLNAGAVILSASCGPCIGQWDRKDMESNRPNCIFTTFNRNFRARNDANPKTKAFLTSPVLAACLAVSGRTGFNPETDSLTGADSVEFMLNAPEPPPFPEKGLSDTRGNFTPPTEGGGTAEIKIDPASDRIELLKPFERWDGRDFLELPVLVKTKGKTTTDHISPGGKWLKYRGHITNISENMLEGAINAYTDETGCGTNIITGEKGIKLPELARFYGRNTAGFIIIGDENYGEGSSREHAAMSPRFLGARAVIVRSFARIHEANLKKQGILALTFSSRDDYDRIGEYDRISLLDLKGLKPGKPVKGVIKRKDGTSFEMAFNHTFTAEQIEWFKAGSALNTMNAVD